MDNFRRHGFDCHIGNGDGANEWHCVSLSCCSEECCWNGIEFVKLDWADSFNSSWFAVIGFGVKRGATIRRDYVDCTNQ
jgi:hypothetical protein